ncbi:glycosyltransferase family 2 protein [Mariniflexile soesokkakense]|uniref:Glycosyltransferase family 2 protein n=1 Tax=Mariniflexile soesokkakense TaxID=1343160 RepID=A0ABV0A8E5_9FLAO
MSFLISVIIPAYNVERFIEKAINSALLQPEVNEVVVVNDGSTDKTLQILKTLQISNSKIKIYQHQNKVNKGRSASRNLGIKHAKENYIAFLDADDFYLEDRFANDKKIFEENKKADGVYNAVGFHFYREVTPLEKEQLKLNTITKKIKPEKLFDAIISSKYGYLHLNGLTVRKSVFNFIGYFNEQLMVAEDSDIIFKMAIKCRLESGIIEEPLALRGIHETNVFDQKDLYKKYNMKLYESIISWSSKNQISIDEIDVVFNWLWVVRFREKNKLHEDLMYWVMLFMKNPEFLFSYLSVKYFPIIRLRKKLFPFLYKQ